MAAIGSAAEQGDLWSERALDWAEVQEGTARPLYEVVLERTGVGAETTLLDLGCGAGMFLSLAAATGADVTGVDASPAMLALAHERLPQADLHPGDLEDLPFGDAIFDIVTGFNSFQYVNDPANAAREAARVARDGGPVVVGGWGDPADCDAAAFFAALAPLMPPLPPGSPGPFALAEPAALEGVVGLAGLEPGPAEDVVCPWDYPDLETALRGLSSYSQAVRAIRHSGEAAVRDAVTAALEPFMDRRGGYHLENTFRFVVGRK